MRRTGSSIFLGSVLAVLCGQSQAALAQTEGAAVDPGGSEKRQSSPEPPRQRLSDSSELERIVSLYSGGKYEECTREVAKLLDAQNKDRLVNPAVIEDARLYHATCLVMSGREKEAILPLRAALTQNPTMGTPDSLTFPPPLISLFLQVRKEFADAIKAEEKKRLQEVARIAEAARAKEKAERRRISKLETLASTEVVIRQNSRFVASLPLGVGQFQNGSTTLGTVFLVSEALLLGTSMAAAGIANYQYTLLRPGAYGNDIERNVKTARTVAIIGFYGFAAVAAGGIAEAHINFVPQARSERRRELPQDLTSPGTKSPRTLGRLLPWVQAGRESVSAGVAGIF
jgi:hypothetical protein